MPSAQKLRARKLLIEALDLNLNFNSAYYPNCVGSPYDVDSEDDLMGKPLHPVSHDRIQGAIDRRLDRRSAKVLRTKGSAK